MSVNTKWILTAAIALVVLIIIFLIIGGMYERDMGGVSCDFPAGEHDEGFCLGVVVNVTETPPETSTCEYYWTGTNCIGLKLFRTYWAIG